MPRMKYKKSKREQRQTKTAAAVRKEIRKGRSKSAKFKW